MAVKVFDGICLAADSATTLPLIMPGQTQATDYQVWNHADKVFHLHRDLPIGLATWGTANIEAASIATLAKDLRRRLMGRDPDHVDWELNSETYTIEGVADRIVELMFDELLSNTTNTNFTGFLLVGYSSNARHPEAWVIQLTGHADRPTPTQLWKEDDSGWWVAGQPEATTRLFNGYSPDLENELRALSPPNLLIDLKKVLTDQPRIAVVDSMPFADALRFAKFCVDTTIGYASFVFGANTVGGAVDLAGISRHEGFKWIERKHYYPAKLNPRRPHEHDK